MSEDDFYRDRMRMMFHEFIDEAHDMEILRRCSNSSKADKFIDYYVETHFPFLIGDIKELPD